MKVLVDECVDWRLMHDLVGHEVRSARQMGWSTVKNGELLAVAAKHFDVFVTVDRNLSFADLRPLVPELLASLSKAKPGTVTYVGG